MQFVDLDIRGIKQFIRLNIRNIQTEIRVFTSRNAYKCLYLHKAHVLI